jgi:3-oxoacyl-[acyl-carrier protein] reductase
MDLGLSDKVTVVAASSRGLGKAVALAFMHEGAKVAIAARDPSALRDAAREMRQATGANVLATTCDVTIPESVNGLIEEVISEYGRIDILVTNAAGPPPGRFVDLKIDQWDDAIQLTLMSTVRLCQAALPHMRRQSSGSIVNMTSFTVKQPEQNLILSNSLRLAVIGLTKTLANELGPEGIRVNAIAPGWIQTERVDELLRDRASRQNVPVQQIREGITRQIPLGRMGNPDELAKAVVFLASPAASYINGVTLQVDGGIIRGAL